MKKLIFLFCGLFFAVGCNDETPDTRQIVWKNNGIHPVEMTIDGWFEGKILPAGGEFSVSGKTAADFENRARVFRHQIPSDIMHGAFDTEREPSAYEWASSGPHDINCYVFDVETNSLTYTFTDEDFEAAKTMGRWGVMFDPSPVYYFTWINQSDYSISLRWQGNAYMGEIENKPVLHSGEKHVMKYVGATSSGSTFAMTVRFDDAYEYTYGKYVYLYQRDFPAGYNLQYDPTWSPNFTNLTYTFTNADYEAVKALASQE